jgi:hypothetical protein
MNQITRDMYEALRRMSSGELFHYRWPSTITWMQSLTTDPQEITKAGSKVSDSICQSASTSFKIMIELYWKSLSGHVTNGMASSVILIQETCPGT